MELKVLDFDPRPYYVERDSASKEEEEREAFGLFQLFGYDKEKGGPPPRPPPDCDPVDEFERDWTEEEERIYNEQVTKSDGFDVGSVPATEMFNLIRPCNINEGYSFIDYELSSKLAVEEYNRRFKGSNGELEFVRILKAMMQPCMFMRYYLTFDAKDLADEKIKTYQAVILWGMGGEISVLSFRRKPPNVEGGRVEA